MFKLINFMIVPPWLLSSLEDNHLSLNTLYDSGALSDILSAEDLYFYRYVNSNAYVSMLAGTSIYQILNRMFSNNHNYVGEMLKDVAIPESYLVNDLPLRLLYRQAPNGQDRITTPLYLEYRLVGNDVLCMIPRVKSEDSNLTTKLQRSLYKVLSKFMTTHEIVMNPIFGV